MERSTDVPVIRVSCFRADWAILSHVIRTPTITLSELEDQPSMEDQIDAHVVVTAEGIVEAGSGGWLGALAACNSMLDGAEMGCVIRRGARTG